MLNYLTSAKNIFLKHLIHRQDQTINMYANLKNIGHMDLAICVASVAASPAQIKSMLHYSMQYYKHRLLNT